VADDYVLKPADRLEFLQERGQKGALEPDELKRLIAIEDQVRQIAADASVIRRAVLGPGEQPNDVSAAKKWYTPKEVARLLGKRPYTVREWCRLGRINARKRQVGRGAADGWEISADEIDRYKNHDLLPTPTKY